MLIPYYTNWVATAFFVKKAVPVFFACKPSRSLSPHFITNLEYGQLHKHETILLKPVL